MGTQEKSKETFLGVGNLGVSQSKAASMGRMSEKGEGCLSSGKKKGPFSDTSRNEQGYRDNQGVREIWSGFRKLEDSG